MKKLNVLRKAVKRFDAKLSSYRLDLEVISSEDITKDVFVKQRLRTISNTINDVFVGVCSPAQLEDLDINSPSADTTYFRTSTVSLVSTNPQFLYTTFDNICSELQLLCDEAQILDEVESDGLFSITADEVSINMTTSHTHYRIPLTAAPCGVQEIYTDPSDGIEKVRIIAQDTNLSGWLTVESFDPSGTYFKYNIARDSSLGLVWPIPATYIAYAHITLNGVTSKDVLINTNGIFWKSNKFTNTPWPRDYGNTGNTGLPANQITFVLDCIK